MCQALASCSLRPAVEALISLRGVNLIAVMTVPAELGDLSRYDSPRQLMSFLGLVPSERSSGPRRRQKSVDCCEICGDGGMVRIPMRAGLPPSKALISLSSAFIAEPSV